MTRLEYLLQTYGEKQSNGCIFSTLKDKVRGGYPRIRVGSKNILFHRLILSLKLERELKDGMEACHSCDTPRCINPEHLWEGTHEQNIKDAKTKGSHAYRSNGLCANKLHDITNPLSLYTKPNGKDECRLCRQEAIRIWKENDKKLKQKQTVK